MLLFALPSASCSGTAPVAVSAEPLVSFERLREPSARTSAPARPSSALELDSLSDCVAHGLGRHPGLHAEYERAKASAERASRAGALPDPRFTFTEFVEELQTRTGPNERRYQLEQRFPWPGTLGARERAARAAAERDELAARAYAFRLRERIEIAWHELVFATQRLRIRTESLELVEGLLPVVQSRVESGRGEREDLLRLEVEIAQLERQADREALHIAPLRSRLAAEVGCPLEALPEAIEAARAPAVAEDRGAWEERVLATHPELAVRVAEVQRESARAELAERAGQPDLGLGLTYLDVGDALDPSIQGSGDDPIGLALSFTVPVWGGSYRAERRESAAALRAARLALDESVHELGALFALRWFELEEARREIALQRDELLPRARQTYELSLSDYTSGRTQLADLIDDEQRLLAFELALARAERDRSVASSRLTGNDLERRQAVKHLVLLLPIAAALALAFSLGRCTARPPEAPRGDAPADPGDVQALWTCPMHPQVVLPSAVPCPLCGMDLVTHDPSSGPGPLRVTLDPGARALAGVATYPVERRPARAGRAPCR